MGKTVVFDSQVVLASNGNASVGSTNETDAALFTTDGATWNCVVWKALDSSYGLTAPVLDTAPDANGTFTFPKPEGAPFFKVIGVRKF